MSEKDAVDSAYRAILQEELQCRERVAAAAMHWWGQVHTDTNTHLRNFEEIRLFEACVEWNGVVKAREVVRKLKETE